MIGLAEALTKVMFVFRLRKYVQPIQAFRQKLEAAYGFARPNMK